MAQQCKGIRDIETSFGANKWVKVCIITPQRKQVSALHPDMTSQMTDIAEE